MWRTCSSIGRLVRPSSVGELFHDRWVCESQSPDIKVFRPWPSMTVVSASGLAVTLPTSLMDVPSIRTSPR